MKGYSIFEKERDALKELASFWVFHIPTLTATSQRGTGIFHLSQAYTVKVEHTHLCHQQLLVFNIKNQREGQQKLQHFMKIFCGPNYYIEN